eukprot:3104294-Amphidinium_carterae.1
MHLEECCGSYASVMPQDTATAAPTLDDPDSVIFSRPPYSAQKGGWGTTYAQHISDCMEVVYYILAGLYFVLVILLLIAVNLDQAERKDRKARAIVPEDSTPCTIAEHYYLREFKTLQLQQDWQLRTIEALSVGELLFT